MQQLIILFKIKCNFDESLHFLCVLTILFYVPKQFTKTRTFVVLMT